MSAYVDEVLARFIRRHEGQYLDHSHAYGPQSPDLIEYYLTDLLGRPWQFRAGIAAHLWDDPQGIMTPDFEKVHRHEPLRRGDVLVFDGINGYGTVGIYDRPGSRVGSVCMFTQNPGPAKVVDVLRDGTLNQLLGAWRLTADAECRIVTDRFAEQLHAAKGSAPIDRWIAEQQQAMKLDVGDQYGIDPQGEIDAAFDRGFEHAKTLPPKKRAAVEAWLRDQQGAGKGPGTLPAQPLEVITDEDMPPRHVYLISGRGHGKTSFIERLKARFGGRP